MLNITKYLIVISNYYISYTLVNSVRYFYYMFTTNARYNNNIKKRIGRC